MSETQINVNELYEREKFGEGCVGGREEEKRKKAQKKTTPLKMSWIAIRLHTCANASWAWAKVNLVLGEKGSRPSAFVKSSMAD